MIEEGWWQMERVEGDGGRWKGCVVQRGMLMVESGKDKRGMMAGGKGSWWQVERVEGGGGRWKG